MRVILATLIEGQSLWGYDAMMIECRIFSRDDLTLRANVAKWPPYFKLMLLSNN